jgi:hypothetical protein
MEDKPRLYFRTDPETKTNFQMYALKKGTTVQEVLESYVQTLLDLDISPSEAIAAIRERAQKKPGEE